MPVVIRPLPVLAQDPECLPAFLYPDTIFLRCFPYIRNRRFEPETPASSAPYEPWDMALESHWRKIHPRAWEILEEDQRKDWAELDRVEEECAEAVRHGTLTEEKRQELQDEFSKLEHRILTRSNRLLALNETRNAVFLMEAARKPGLTIDEFLQALPAGDYSRFAKHPAASLWPLPSIPPPLEGLTMVDLSNYPTYLVPSHPSAAYNAYFAKKHLPTQDVVDMGPSCLNEQTPFLSRRPNAGRRDTYSAQD